jgi:hypothetical protein
METDLLILQKFGRNNIITVGKATFGAKTASVGATISQMLLYKMSILGNPATLVSYGPFLYN